MTDSPLLYSPKDFVSEVIKATKNPDKEAGAKEVAVILSKMRFSEEEISDEHTVFIEQVRKMTKRHPRNRYPIANIFYRAGLYAYAEHVLSSLPKFCTSGQLNLHAAVAHRRGKTNDAVEIWNRALDMDPEYLPAINGLLSIYKAQGNQELVSLMEEKLKTATRVPTAFDLYALVVFKPWGKLKRFGGANDGGYLVMEQGGGYDCLLSGGVGRNVEFEEQACATFGLECYAFDPTVDSLPSTNTKIHFIKKGIGKENSETTTNLSEFLNKHKNVFIKMDVEGFEYNWVESLTDDQIRNIKQIVLEWHHPFTKRRLACLARIAKSHALVHVHPNNYGKCRKIANIDIPSLFETTFVRKDSATETIVPNSTPLPHPDDVPNIAGKPEIALTWWPFVAN